MCGTLCLLSGLPPKCTLGREEGGPLGAKGEIIKVGMDTGRGRSKRVNCFLLFSGGDLNSTQRKQTEKKTGPHGVKRREGVLPRRLKTEKKRQRRTSSCKRNIR